MTEFPESLKTARLVLERLRLEWAEEIFYSYASKPEATKFVSWPTHQSISDTRNYLNYAVHAWNQGIEFSYGIRLFETNRLVGGIGCLNTFGKVQFGYILNPNYWNLGFATEAAKAVISLVAAMPEVNKLWTFTDVDNIASQKVLLHCGLQEEARLKKWFRFPNQKNAVKDCIFFDFPLTPRQKGG